MNLPRVLGLGLGLVVAQALTTNAGAQAGSIAGVVHTRAGAPIEGAHVRTSTDNTQTVTGPTGEFRMQLRAESASAETLHVQRIGYRSQTVVVPRRDTSVRLDIELAEAAMQLDEVVVTATAGTRTRRAQPYVVSTIPVEDLESVVPLATLPDAFQGRVTSVNVTPSSGSSGEAQSIWLRGGTSVTLSNEPLVFIDGVRADARIQRLRPDVGGQASSRLFDIDPADIERVEIVKGPAASGIYGAEASTGVIQIFTRRGEMGQERLSQRASLEAGTVDADWSPPPNFAVCGAADVASTSSAMLCHGLATGAVVSDNPLERNHALRPGDTRELRWSANGGSRNFAVYMSLGGSRETGTLPQNGFNRSSLRFGSRWVPTASLAVDGGFGFMSTRTAHPQNGDNPEYGLLLAATLGSPLTVGSRSDGAFDAPINALTTVDQILHVSRATPTLQLTHDAGRWFNERLTIGVDASNSAGRFFVPLRLDSAFAAGDNVGVVRADEEAYRLTTLDYLGTAQFLEHPRWGLTAKLSVGAQYVESNDDVVIAAGSGLVSNFANRVSDAATRIGTAFGTTTRSLGSFAQTDVAAFDRVFVQLGLRGDRHSAFGSNAGSQWFPKAGVSWVVADGDRIRSIIPGINTLRLRSAYGTSGRAPPQGQSGATYSAAPVIGTTGGILPGLTPANPGNPKLRPERGSELELGADAGFFHDRVGLELTYFDKRSTDLLSTLPQPPSSGFPIDPLGNVDATIRNSGIEATARWTSEIASRQITANLGVATLRNVAPFESDRPLGAMFDHRILSLDTVAGHGIVTDTAVYVGPSMPTRTGFIGSTVEVAHGLRLHADVDGKWGFWLHNMDADVRDRFVRNSERAVLASELSAADRLTHFGPFITTSGREISQTTVLGPYLQDASFVRWRELSLSWEAPRRLAQHLGAGTASLTLAARNLALWTRYEGDPEVVPLISENASGGPVQYGQAPLLTMPQARRMTARLTFDF